MPTIDAGQGDRVLLTERQLACLEGFAQHKSAKEVGRELGISNHAVEKHLKAARQKLGAASTVEALRIYRGGTVEPQYPSSELFPKTSHDQSHPRGLIEDAANWRRLDHQPRWIWETDFELTPRQTLVAIGAGVMCIIVAIALLMAFAQGALALWPWR